MMSKTELAVRTLISKELRLGGAMNVPLDKTLMELDATEFERMYIRFGLEDMLMTSLDPSYDVCREAA
jgi:hypothetical protein